MKTITIELTKKQRKALYPINRYGNSLIGVVPFEDRPYTIAGITFMQDGSIEVRVGLMKNKIARKQRKYFKEKNLVDLSEFAG